MPILTRKQRSELEAAVLADLQDPNLGYLTVALRRQCSVSFVCTVAKRHSITRTRGVKPKSKPASEV
jgi:hypothetical protein